MRTEILFALALVACASSPPAPSLVCPDPTPVYDGGSDDVEAAGSPCSKACSRLRELHCPEGDPSPDGTSCYTVCRRAGPLLDVACVQTATRETLAKCGVRCVQ